MDTTEVIIVAVAAILIIAAVMIGVVVASDDIPAQIHPVGPMTGPEPIHPYDKVQVTIIPMDEIIYISAYYGEDCAPDDRELIDAPIRVVDTDGAVYWHWFYETGSTTRNR